MASTLRVPRIPVLRTLSVLRNVLLAVCATLLWGDEAHATHAVGGQLTYQCVGVNQYLVTLKFYRDCNGVAAPTNCTNGRRFNVKSASCGADFNQCFSLQSVNIITPICPSEIDRCLDNSGTYGLEEYIFTKLVDLSAYAGCGNPNDWVFSWSLCCRNNAITSLSDPGDEDLYLRTEMNRQAVACNNSPTFGNSPAPYYCLGQSVSYNPGAFDVDGDSLAYEIIQPRGTNNSTIPYSSGYSLPQPIHNTGGAGAVQLDPLTGTLTCVPDIQQVAVVTYRVREYRNGVLIGTVMRDVQIVVRPCGANTAPSASGINGTNNYSTTVCAGSPVTFTINTSDPNAGQGTVITWNGGIAGATFTTSGSPFQTATFSWTPTLADIGNNNFAVQVTDNACPLSGSNQYGFTLVVTPPLTPANAGTDLVSCGSATMQAQQPYPQIPGTWSVITGSGTFTPPDAPNAQVTGMAVGTNVYQWSMNYGLCGISTDQVTVTNYDPGQAAANAGPDQALCMPFNTAVLAANTAVAPAVGTWTVVQGAGTFSNANSPTSTVSGLVLGINRFRWTINNGPCAAPTQDEVVITVNQPVAAANAGPDQSVCAPGAGAQLNAAPAPSPATGLWTVLGGSSAVVTTPGSPTSTVTGLTPGTHSFQWTVSNAGCGSTSDQVSFTVYDPASPNANAGPDQTICAANTTLAGNAPISPATGQWTLVSGTGTITTPGSPTSGVTGLGVGANVFQWTLNNGPCANGLTTDQVTITRFDGLATANAGPDQSVCSVPGIATLAANAPLAPTTGSWSVVSGTATITTPGSPNTGVTGLGPGTVILQWSISNGPCGAPSTDQMTITVFDANAVAANAGPDQQLCVPNTSTTLAGNTPTSPATGTWSVVSGSATITTPGSPTSGVSNLGIGTNVLRWTMNNGACANPASVDDVIITVYDNAQANANAGPDQEACSTLPVATLTGNAANAPATGQWSLVSGSGTIATPGSSSTIVSNMGTGANVFKWTVTNGVCGTTDDQVTVLVFDVANPVANAGADQTLCTPNTSTVMAGSSLIFPATGTWELVSGQGIIADAASPVTAISGLGVGTNVFRWSVYNGPCNGTTTDEMIITVFDGALVVPGAGPDQSICLPTFPNLVSMAAGPVAPPAIGTWTLISGSATFADVNDPNTEVSGLASGENVLQWTVNNGACGSLPGDQVSVFVYDAATPAADAGADQNLCSPVPVVTLTGSPLLGAATGEWTLVSGTGVIADPTSPMTEVTGVTVGVSVFAWSVFNGPCANPNTTDQVTITVNDGSAQPASAGVDQELCSTSSGTSLDGNAPVAPATGTWTQLQGPPATITAPTDPNTTVTDLQPGVNSFVWTIDNGACGNSTDIVTIEVFDVNIPAVSAGPDQDMCTPMTSATLAGSGLIVPATGTWTVLTGPGTVVTPGSPGSTVQNLGIGLNTLQWTVDNGPCPTGGSDLVNITVYDAATAGAVAGPDQELCTPAIGTTLAGNTPAAPATGTWTVIQGAAQLVDPTNPTTAVTGLVVGTSVLVWTVGNGPCGMTTDTVRIVMFDGTMPDADAGADQEFCTPFTQTDLDATAPISPATGTWSVVQGTGVFSDPNDPHAVVTGAGTGENIYRWTVYNGPCANGNTNDLVSVLVYDGNNPVANAGPDQAICLPVTSTVLAGSSVTFPATGTWTLVSGTGLLANVNDPNTGVTGLTVGVNVFVWTVDNGPCANGVTTDTVRVLIYDQAMPTADAGPDQSFCSVFTSATLAGSTVTFPGQGTWTVVSGAGVFSDEHDPATTVTGAVIGENIYAWTVDNGPCSDPITSDQVSIFVYDANNPDADAGPGQELCTPSESTTMQGSTVTFPAQGTWTLVSGAGVFVDPNSPLAVVTGLAIGDNVFEWTVNNGPCANGTTTDQVTITVFDAGSANADAGPDQDLCSTSPNTVMAGSVVNYPAEGTWTLIDGAGTIADVNDPASAITGLAVGENIFQWTVSNGPCENANTMDQVSIFVYDEDNAAADAGPDQDLCTPATTTGLAGSPVTFPATGTWTVVSGPGMVVNANDPASAVVDLGVGVNVLVWTVDNGPCANGLTTDTVRINLFDDANPVADAGPDQDLCTPASSAQLAGSALIIPAQGTWTILQGTGTFSDVNDPQATINGLSVGETIIRWSVDNGPCANGLTADTLSIFLYDDGQAAADAGPDQQLCTPTTSTNLSGSAVTFPGTGTWSLLNGQGAIADPNDPNTLVTDLAVGENVFQWVVTNGPCSEPLTTDEVSIFVFDHEAPIADAGPDKQICTPIDSTVLSGSALVFPATGTWTIISGTAVITDPSDPHSSVTGIGVGVLELEWTVSNGPCGPSSDQVSIELFDLNSPPASAGPDQEFCTPNTSTVLAGNAPTPPGTGVWSVFQGAALFADDSDPGSGVSGLPVGENILVWTLEQGVCGTSHDSVSVFIFDAEASGASAGPDVEQCMPMDSTFLAGNAPVFPAHGTWTVIEGAGMIDDPNDPGTLVTNLAIGNNTFVWQMDNGPCPNGLTTDTVTVVLFSDSTDAPDAGPDLETCLPLTFAQLEGEAPTPPASGGWTVIGGVGNVADPTDPQSMITDLEVGITTLVWTLDLGPCPNNGLLTDTVDIYIYDPSAPLADAGPDQQLCTPEDTTLMQALIPTFPGEGTWTLVGGSGTISDIHDPAAMITGLSVGLNQFEWMVYNGNCGQGPPSRDTVTIAVFDGNAPLADAGADQQLCAPETSTQLGANSAVFPGTGTWSIITSGGGVSNASDPQSMASSFPVGDNLLVWTIDNGACGTSTDTLLIAVFDGSAQPANAGPDQDICVPTQPNEVTMAANAPVYPASGQWTISGTGTIADPADPHTLVTGMQPGITVLTWTIDNGPCGPVTTDQMQIITHDAGAPVAQAGPDMELCTPTGEITMVGNPPQFPATGAWTVVNGSGTLVDPTSPNSGITGLEPGVSVLVWSIDNGACGTTTDTLTISVYDNTSAASNAGDDREFCDPDAVDVVMLGSVPAPPATGAWELVAGSGTITDPTNPFTAVTGIGFGVNVFQWSVDNGVCGTSSDEMTITVYDQNEQPASAGEDRTQCHDVTSAALNAAPLVSQTATGLWTLIAGTGDIDTPTAPSTEVENLTVGQNILVWTVTNGVCPATTDTVIIGVNDCSKIRIPDAFSPNGDGVNDTYMIEGLLYYRQNSIQVFNRWGTRVLERSPYNNDWDGRSEASLNWGEELPESTYYYILDLGNGDEPYTGYIYLKR